MKRDVENALELPPTINTVKERHRIAQRFRELAEEQLRICENLVLDQHLQQQGIFISVLMIVMYFTVSFLFICFFNCEELMNNMKYSI